MQRDRSPKAVVAESSVQTDFKKYIKILLYQSKCAIFESPYDRKTLIEAVGKSICTLRDINHQMKDLDESKSEQVIKQLKNIKPVAMYWNQFPCQITSKSAFNKSFDPEKEFDWHRLFVHCNSITVEKVPLSDYVTRNTIRSQNIKYLELAVPQGSKVKNFVVNCQDIAILKCALEYGIFPVSAVSSLLLNIKNSTSSVQKLLEAEDLWEDYIKNQAAEDIDDVARNLVPRLELVKNNPHEKAVTDAVGSSVSAEDAIQLGCSVLSSLGSSHSQSMLLDVVMLALVLYFDQETDATKSMSIETVIKRTKKWLFDELLKDDVQRFCDNTIGGVDDKINHLMLMLTSVEADPIVQSYRYLERHADILAFHNDSLAGVGDRGFADAHTNKIRLLMEDMLGEGFDRSSSKVNDSYCKEGSSYLEAVARCLVDIENSLALRFKEEKIDMLEFAKLYKRQPLARVSIEYKYSFVISNGIYYLLSIAQSLLPAVDGDDHTHILVGIIMRLLCTVCMGNPLAIGHLFSDKEYSMLLTLLKVDRPYSCLALAAICKSNPNCFGDRLEIVDRLTSFTNVIVYEMMFTQPYGFIKKSVDEYSLKDDGDKSDVTEDDRERAAGGFTDRKYDSIDKQRAIHAFACFNLLYSIVASATDMPSKAAISTKIQKSIASLMKLLTIFNTTHDCRWDVDVKLADDSGMPTYIIDGSLSMNTIMWMTAYMYIKTLNETLTCCSSYIDRRNVYLHSSIFYEDDGLSLNSRQFDDIESGLVYYKEIVVLYTRLIAIEIENPSRGFDTYIQFGNDGDIKKYFKDTAQYAIDLIESLNEFKSYRFKQEYELINKAFMLEGVLPMCFKFMNAVLRYVDQSNYHKTGIDDLMSTIVDNRAILTRMINRVELLKSEKTGMFVQTVVDINIGDKKGDITDDGIESVDSASITQFKYSILKLYEGDHARYLKYIDMYKHVRPQTVNSKAGIPIFAYVNRSCNLMADSMKAKCESYIHRSSSRLDHACRKLAQQAACQNEDCHADIRNDDEVCPDVMNVHIHKSTVDRINSYVTWKINQLTKSNSYWYRLLDEGSERAIDYYYDTLVDWFMCYTSKAMYNTLIDHTAYDDFSDSDLSNIDSQTIGSKMMARLSLKLKPLKVTDSHIDDVSREVIADKKIIVDDSKPETLDTAIDLFISRPEVSSWLTVIDTLVRVKGESIRDIIYSRYLDRSTGLKGQSEFNNLQIKMIKKNETDAEDKEKKQVIKLHEIGSKVFECIFRATLTVQMELKNSVCTNKFYLNFTYFFHLSSFIIAMADDNYKNFKVYVGKVSMYNKSQYLASIINQLNINVDDDSLSKANSEIDRSVSDDSDADEYSLDHIHEIQAEISPGHMEPSISRWGFLALFLKGMILENDRLESKLAISSRTLLFNQSEEVVIYNSMLLGVQKEFFTGPCQQNQQIYIADISSLLKPLYTIDQEIWDIRFLYQTAIVEYLLSLLEGNIDIQLNAVGQRQPSEFYDLAVLYMQYLWIQRKMAIDRDLKPSTVDMLEWIDYPKSAMEIVSTQYQKETKFASHPAINIAIGLVHVINAVQTRKRQYRRFVSEKHTDTLELYGSVGIEIELSMVNKKQKLRPLNKEFALNQHKNKKLIFFHFVNIISCTIEVSIKNQKLCVPYQVIPKCFFLTRNTKKNFRMKCDISDPSRKLLALMDATPVFIIEMDHYLKIYQKSPLLFWMSSNDTFTRLMRVTWWICLAMNVAAAYDWGFVNKGADRIFVKPYTTNLIVYVSTMVIISISSIVIILWTALMSPMAIKKTDEGLAINQRSNVKMTKQDQDLSDSDNTEVAFNREHNPQSKIRKLHLKRHFLPWMELFRRELFFPSFFVFHLGVALLSFIDPIFLAIHLFTITYISATSRYVLAAIYKPVIQLTFALVLMLFITLIYSVIVARFYNHSFKPSESQNIDFCDNIRGCLLFVLDLGLRKGGGIGEALEVYPFDESRFYTKAFFDITFFLLINVIMLNIFFSIIVGAFNDLRHDLQSREDDVMNTCFVCGFTRKDFEKQERPFDFHIQFEHNIWDYVNFLVYLADNLGNDYSGNEYYLQEKYSRRSTEWLPIDGTIYLDESRDEAKGNIKLRIDKEMRSHLKGIFEKLLNINIQANTYFSKLPPTYIEARANKSVNNDKEEAIEKQHGTLKQLQANIIDGDKRIGYAKKEGIDLVLSLENVGETVGFTEEKQTIKSIVVKELMTLQQYIDSQITLIGSTYSRQKKKRIESLNKIDEILDTLLAAKKI